MRDEGSLHDKDDDDDDDATNNNSNNSNATTNDQRTQSPAETASSTTSSGNNNAPLLTRSLQSGSPAALVVDSPLRQALAAAAVAAAATSKVTASTASSATPLLKASLNSPPVAHMAKATGAGVGPTASISSNGSVDLTLGTARKRTVMEVSSSAFNNNNSKLDDNSSSNKRSSPSSSEMYANLIMHLRQQQSSPTTTTTTMTSTNKSRKEKLKNQPCFQCPICKKRFQRHIAMNAHFQNEHIGQVQSHKVCRICSHRAKNIATIRNHFLKEHQIDLDTPSSFLVEPEGNAAAASGASIVTKAATITKHPKFRSGLMLDIDSGPAGDFHSDISSSSSSPTTLAPPQQPHQQQGEFVAEQHGVTIKRERGPVSAAAAQAIVDDNNQARDLSIRKSDTSLICFGSSSSSSSPNPSPASSAATMAVTITKRSSPPIVQTASKRHRPEGVDALNSGHNQWQCQHCDIVFPNQTLYFLHRGFHSEGDPWRCNGCGQSCQNSFQFNTHLVSDPHN